MLFSKPHNLVRIALTAGLMLFASSCSQRASRSLSPEVAQTLNVAKNDYSELVRISLRRWSTEDKDPKFAYSLDPDNPLITAATRRSLDEIFRPEADVIPEDSYVAYIDEVAIPHTNFAFLTMRTTNRYDATEYAIVCERTPDGWRVRDYFLVAEGLMQTALHNFNWDGYESRLIRDGLVD